MQIHQRLLQTKGQSRSESQSQQKQDNPKVDNAEKYNSPCLVHFLKSEINLSIRNKMARTARLDQTTSVLFQSYKVLFIKVFSLKNSEKISFFEKKEKSEVT